MRVIGLDYGSVTCGVAISDETLLIASPVETIRYKTMEELLTKLDIYFNELLNLSFQNLSSRSGIFPARLRYNQI